MTVRPRVVLDTNVVVSALVFGAGRLAEMRIAWQGKRFLPLVSKATVEELLRVLRYPKFQLTQQERESLLGDYLPWCTVVTGRGRAPRIPGCPDVHDLPFLQLASMGRARAFVTGDKALLRLDGRWGFPILDPARFLDGLPNRR